VKPISMNNFDNYLLFGYGSVWRQPIWRQPFWRKSRWRQVDPRWRQRSANLTTALVSSATTSLATIKRSNVGDIDLYGDRPDAGLK
jgi:hypothetical protein